MKTNVTSISVEAFADAARQIHRYHFITGMTIKGEYDFVIHTEAREYIFHTDNGKAMLMI